jgi:hypothetical protein
MPKPRRRAAVFCGGIWYVEEKIDGSQLSFRLISAARNTILYRTKTRYMSERCVAWNSLFANSMLAINAIKALLNPHFIYRGEAVCRPHHGVLHYARAPARFFVLFEVFDTQTGKFLLPAQKKAEAQRLGLEVTPLLMTGEGEAEESKVWALLEQMEQGKVQALLGGKPGMPSLPSACFFGRVSFYLTFCIVYMWSEGCVVKNYSTKGPTGMSTLKLVRSEFREALHSERELDAATSRANTPEQLIDILGLQYAVPARYHKVWFVFAVLRLVVCVFGRCCDFLFLFLLCEQAVQHLIEARDSRRGTGTADQKQQPNAPSKPALGWGDMSALTNELDADLYKEAHEQISTALMSYFFPKIATVARHDFGRWFEAHVLQTPPKAAVALSAAAATATAGAADPTTAAAAAAKASEAASAKSNS